MKIDTVIKNGMIVTPGGISQGGIAISGEKIVMIGSDENLPPAEKTIDAKGNYIIPGLVDSHAHLLVPPTDWAEWLSTETPAAVAGGCTTAITMQQEHGAGGIVEAWKKVTEAIEAGSYLDWAVNAAIFTRDQIKEIPAAVECGISSFKFLMQMRGRGILFGLPPIDDGTVYLGLEKIGELFKEGYKVFARIHAETTEVISAIEDKYIERGVEPATFTEVRPNFIEAEAMQRVIAFAKATGCPLFIVHMSIKEGPDIIARAQLGGVDIVAETCPHYLILNVDNIDKFVSKVIPPIRHKEDNEALWRAIQNGTVDYVGTDHVPFTREERGTDFFKAQPGLAGVETWLPIMLSEGVNKGRITLERLVEVCCYNPAKKHGLIPRKGMISVGSDADLVIVDLNKKAKVSADALYTRARDFYSYDGWKLNGWPVMTMIRGNVVMEDGKVVGERGFGRYVPSQVK